MDKKLIGVKKKSTVFIETPNPFEDKKVVFIEDANDKENADGVKGHLETVGNSDYHPGVYDKYVKRGFDIILSLGGLVLLSPIYVGIAIAIMIDDPGPLLFTQKRIGRNKRYFKLHKFRSMKMNTPHDVPTHMLDNPDQYITRVGKFLRAHSLDELPQIWDIFIGNMSVIGPRPGLWNQDVLIAERDKYGANDVKPGLTGWAQINGRDELSISLKAQLDGEYVEKESFLFDAKCFLGTISKVGRDVSVVEGGARTKKGGRRYTEGKSAIELIGQIGFSTPVTVDTTMQKKVLISGRGSYIGESFRIYAAEKYTGNFIVDVVDMRDPNWKDTDFLGYDIVYHVAGIAHADIGDVSYETKENYYSVNTDLAVKVGKAAKRAGVKKFIFMSSMIVYGDSAAYGRKKVIDRNTIPNPSNFYGDSKLQADVAVRSLADENFTVVVLRPPMIYGRGSKGNYQTLAKLANRLPVFPNVNNERSMLYIDNLCELLCQIMLVENCVDKEVVLLPQNSEWTNTAEMVKEISEAAGGKIRNLKILDPIVSIVSRAPGKIGGLTNKAFGNNCYSHAVSVYPGIDYQNISMRESIRRIEEKRMLMLASVASMIDQFNMSNIEILLKLGYKVDVACNFEQGNTCSVDRIVDLKKRLSDLEVNVYQIDFTRSVINLSQNLKAYKQVKKLVESKKYSFIHCHSPIGGVVGRIVAHKKGTKVIYTAHGFHFFDGAPKKNWVIYYPIEKFFSHWTDVLITINKEDYNRAKKDFYAKETLYIPGVGVNTEKFHSGLIDVEKKRRELGVDSDHIMFLSVGELSERKNHEIVIRAMKELNNPQFKYLIVGKGKLKEYLKRLIADLGLESQVFLLGYRTDVSELCQAADLFVFPSHQEGLPVALMEAIACNRPVICSRIRGNEDLVKDESFMFDENEVKDLVYCLKNKLINHQGELKNRKEFLNSMEQTVIENYNHLKTFDLETVQKDMETIYKKCVWGGIIRLFVQQRLKKELGIGLNSVLVLSVGELNKNKNHSTLIKAISKLDVTNVHFLIAGIGDQKVELQNLATVLGISDRVHFLGYRNDMEMVLQSVDIYCLPSIREGLNVSLMEAMASGLPCVVSKIRGNIDLIEDGEGGYLISWSDVEGFAEKIKELAEGNCLRMKLINSNMIKNFDMLSITKKMEKLYANIL